MMNVVSNMKGENFSGAVGRVRPVVKLDMKTKVCGVGFCGEETSPARPKPNMLVASLDTCYNIASPTT